MKVPHNVNKTAYHAVMVFSTYEAQYNFLAQYGYLDAQIPLLLKAASEFFKLEQYTIVMNSPPHKPQQITIPHTTENEHNV